MGNRTVLIYIITQVFNILHCFAQEENGKSVKQQATLGATLINSEHDKVISMDKDSLLIIPDSVRKSNIAIPLNSTGYVALPWGNSSFRGGPFKWDYAVYGRLGSVRTFSTHQTLPILGSYTYVRFMYPFQLTDKLSISLGFFLGKYSLARRVNDDFGLNLGINYMFTPSIYLNFEHQQSFRQGIIGISPRMSPLYPNTNTNFNLQIEPVQGVKVKVGYLKE